jgi:hypothetical protein
VRPPIILHAGIEGEPIIGRIKRAWSFECSFKGTACYNIGYEDFKVKLISNQVQIYFKV